jgi:hypothetical protein
LRVDPKPPTRFDGQAMAGENMFSMHRVPTVVYWKNKGILNEIEPLLYLQGGQLDKGVRPK